MTRRPVYHGGSIGRHDRKGNATMAKHAGDLVFTLRIECANAAFGDAGTHPETARILRELSRTMSDGASDSFVLRDGNGNRVGTATFMHDRDLRALSSLRTALARAGKRTAPSVADLGDPAYTPPEPGASDAVALALDKALELLETPAVRFKICDGGPGNLGMHSAYHAAINAARAALRSAKL